MKKMFKKALSVLLAVLMVISVVPASTLMSASASAASLGYVVGDVVEFGSYPQSKVTDSVLLEELNALTLEWKSYGFMSGDGEFGSMTESDYMKYADVELDDEKYRAVTFTQYRPNLTYIASTEKNSNQDDNGYFTDAVYWFRFEPLKWRIIDAEAGLIMSESLVDAQPYAETVYYHENGGSTEDDYYLDFAHRTYANNYEDASLRDWLNEEFYTTAFSDDEKSKVLTYKCDNSAAVSKYDSGSTRDYVFIPSSDDVNNADMGFASDSDRTAEGTDYAKALGLYTPDSGENSFWWLRTPGTYSYYACRVDNSGKTDDYGNSVDFTNYGIRPVIRYDFDGAGERYTATFMVDGEIYAQNSYAVGDEIIVPEDPEKEGYTFKEWDATIPATMGYEDMTFNATWVANAYTVTFHAGDGAFTDGDTVKTVTADYGSAVNCIDEVPSLQGYEFTGWYDENGNPVTFPVTVTADMTLTAHYAAGAFTVTYYDGDTVYTVQDYTYGDAISAPEAPAKAGYVFKGWSMIPGGAVSENLGSVTGNMSFYAVWAAGETSYKINIYQMNTLGMFSTKPSETKTLSAVTGDTVIYEPEERDGFTVDSRSTLSATVAADGSTVLKVYYARNQYTLTVDGVEYILYYGATVPAEVKKVPEKEGLEHIGYVDANGERAEIPEKMPAENITLTSEWASAYYTLTLIVDGMYTTYKYAYGDYIDAFEDMLPTKEGYVFAGWGETEEGGISDLPDTMPATDLTYYAVWDRMIISLAPADGSEIVVDNENMIITGVPEGITESELRNALEVSGDGYIEITLIYKNKVGTGAVVSLYDNVTGDKLGDYIVVIMGDLDGDGVRRGEDAKILSDEIVGITCWSFEDSPEYNIYLVMASEVNGDGRINANDFALLGFGTYDINIYTMHADGSYEETESVPGYGLVGETFSYTPDPAEEGFYIDTEKSVLSGTVSATEQLTLSVYYAREQYTITYSIDGYEIEHKYNYGAQIDIPAEPVKEGHTFVGWTPEIPETMPAQDLYFEAVYEINMYTLTFDAREGCFADGSNSISMVLDYGEFIDMFELPTRDGYIFVGWDDGNGGALPVHMPAEDLHLTAVWEPITDTPYTLEGYVMDTTGEYVLAYSVTKSGVTGETVEIVPEELEGFTFDAEKSVTSGVIAADGSTVLKVYYARNLHTVTFTVDGAVYAESVYYYGSTLVEPVQPEKAGYSFMGWAVEGSSEIITLPQFVESNLTFVAVFSEKCEYSITLDANGGRFDDGETVKIHTVKAGETVEFDIQPIREAYLFAGWQDENGNSVSLPITMPAADVELFAVWNQDLAFCRIQHVTLITDSYKQQNLLYEIMVKGSPEKVEFLENNSEVYTSTVVFDRNEAFVPDDLTEIGIVSIRCVDCETGEEISDESGYFFDNYCEVWTVVASLPEGEYKVRAKVDASDNSWEAVDYSYDYWLEYEDVNFDLQLDANGGYFTQNATNHIIVPNMCYGESIEEYYEEPVRDGYKFMGWEDDSHNIVEINGTMPDINGTLYAVWEELSSVYDHTITFDADGGDFGDGSDVYTVYADYDDVLQYPPEPCKEGYTFMGWYPYVSDVVEGDATYTATWEVNEYTATYYVDGEVYEAYPIYYGDEVDMPADPYIEGRTFVGWSPDVPATMPAMDLEFHAVFEAPAVLNITTPEANLASSGTNAVTVSGIINLSDADVSLEFTEAYYVGEQIFPAVYLQYGDELFDAKKELIITYLDNNKVGTAKAILEGLNRFSGSAELEFTISYEEIPEQIVNATAVGDIGKILLSWGISSEVGTSKYNIYRRDEGSDEYTLIKTVNGRENLSYTDSAVEEGKTYIYYITGVGTYGAESLPSAEVYATVQSDKEGPTVFKLKPASNSTLYATQTLSINAEDNIGIAKAVYSYSEDNGATWNVIGEATGSGFACKFDTTVLSGTSVSVKVVAYDAAGNASDEVINTYKVDNIGPEKVTGLSAAVQSSIITLSWNNVADADADYFILQQKINGTWKTVQSNLKTRGANVENLQAETDYTFRVACVDIRGNVGEFSDEFTVATGVDTMIPAITGQSPDPSRFRSAFTYTATAQDECGIKSIKVQYSYDEESWTDISTKTFTDAARIQSYSVKINTDEYNEGYLYIRAIATDISGNESISDAASNYPYRGYYIDRTAPDAPTGLKASGQDGYVSLEWTVGTENDLGGYYVYRATEENGEYTAIMSNRAVYNYPDQTVERGKTYYYKIRVSDTCGNMSGYSAVVSAKMLDDTIKPVVRSIGETYNNSLSKSYNTFNVVASDNNMLSYMVVEYCTTKNMTYAEAARAESIADSYKNLSVKIPMDGLESGDKVYVRAYAVDVMGLKSDYVNAQYTVDLTAPSASDFKASIANDKVTLTWNDCGEADLAGFKVYYSANGKDYTSAGTRGVKADGVYTITHYITAKQSGTYYYKLVPVDKLQNSSELITSVEYIYVAPPEPEPGEDEPPVIIVNEAPVASFTYKAFMILDVEDIFDASESTDDSEITEYIWDFGDGTSSTEIRPVKKYSAVGTYEVTLTVKDAEGLQHSVTQTVEVKEREKLGTLKVRVVDENGSAVAYAPVYFDLGNKEIMQKVVTDASGTVTMLLPDGTHRVGAYKDHYLPADKEIVVLPNATRTITLTIVKGDIITGEFEITRMTFDEIIAAGIDPYDPDNRQVYSATVRFTYGTTPVNINYYRNSNSILSYNVSDSNTTGPNRPSSYTPTRTFKTPDGEERKIVNVTYIGGDNNNDDVVAILDVPAQASYLKEFFDVKLHIVNNAASNFIMKNNEIKLNVPDGMTLMTGLNGGYQNSDTVYIDAIKGQNTVTISWCLRGDVAGEYDLTADYTGILADFEELVTTTFKTEEPIKVYGLEGVKFRILGSEEIHNDTLYFNIELENERPVDLLLPDINVVNSKVLNVTDRVLGTGDAVFESTAYLLNIYVQLGNGKKQYLPIVYGPNGNLTANLEVLAPGQKLVHEYVAYNAINYDGIAYFQDAAILEFEGLLENIEVGSFKKERYSFIDYSEKLGNILSSGDPEVAAAWNYIDTDSNYYYVDEANQGGTLRFLYNLANTVINADPSGFVDGDMKDKAKEILLSVLTDESVLGKIDELTGQKYYYAINSYLADAKAALMIRHDKAEVESAFEELYARIDWLTEKYVIEGSIAFYDGVTSIIDNHLTSGSIEVLQFTPMAHFGKALDDTLAWSDTILDALTSVQKDVYVQGVLKFESNVEYSNFILDAILMASESLDDDISSAIVSIVKEFKEEINESVKQYRSKLAEIAQYAATEATFHLVGQKINEFVGNCIGSSVMSVVKVVFNFAMWALGADDYMKQKAMLRAYDQIGDAFLDGFARSSSVTNTVDDFYYLTLLRAGCETRLGGEATYKQFILDYIGGKNLDPVEEAEALDAINDVMGTSYSSIDAWYDVVQYEIVSSRDILFNIEFTETNIPSAPSVTLDYENCQTVQSFGDDYEYCFGDGVWKSCNGKPVKFELDTVPQTLRVRVAASDSNLAGEITTVRIYAQKELSKLITVKYDNGKYIFSNLASQRSYEAVILNTSISSPDWSEAMYVSGGEISCDTESNYIALRSRPNANLVETYSLPLVLKVQKKQLLDLEIEGDGTVEQSNASGEYFVGDTVDLIATPHTGCEFLGWYVDGELVSRDVHYILEYADGVKVKAEFTGVTVKSIEIESMPSKTVYTVGETLSTEGMTLKVKYSDFSTKVIDSGFTCSESVLAKDGETTVTVTYGGATTEFTVNVYKEYYILTWVVEGESVDFEMKYGEALEFDINIDRPGYEFTGWTPEVPATMPAHDLTLTATFKPIAYDAIFDANGGVFADGATDMTVSVDYDAKIPAPVAPEKQGYLFAGWSYNGVIFGENLGTMRDVYGMVFKAEWIAETDTVYKIETYTMDTAGEYVLSTQLLSGTTGETVTAEPVVDEGFVLNAENSVLSGVIAGDDSLVLKVYIDRLTYTLTVDNGTQTVSDTYYYGAMIAPVEAPAKTGYTFKGWDSEFPSTMPAKDMTITAIFEANTYDAVFMNGSEIFKTVNIVFGEKIEAPADVPEKENYNFIGWSLDGTIILSDLGMMDETGKTFYAVWQAYTPDHEHIPHTVTVDATCTVEGMEYTICLECGETIGEAVVLPALNHSKTLTVTVESTCTVPGMQYEICEFCGETIGDAVVLPLKEHTPGEWETVIDATCVESGEKVKKCSVCGEILENGEIEALGHNWGEWETAKEADCVNNGEQKRICTRDSSHSESVVIPALGHKAGDWETSKAATCTEKGEQIKKCTVCGETVETGVLDALGHTPAKEWTVVLKPTTEKEGKRVIKCLVCGAAVEEDAISKLEVAHHEDTDVAIEYQPDDYDGNVSINVEETFDGGAFNVVNTQTGSARTQIYDITMTVDGKETQPEGKVTVRIPLPEGYNPNRSFVYHIDTKTGKAVKMNSRYESGYLVFETDHFSYYAVVDESQTGTAVNATLSIKQPSITTVKYGDTLILHAEIKGDIPEGARLEWSVEGEGMTIKPSADGKTCAVTSTAKGEVTVKVKLVDKNGNALSTSEGAEITAQQKLTSKAGFFQKLISFFKNLFRMNRIIEQAVKSIF